MNSEAFLQQLIDALDLRRRQEGEMEGGEQQEPKEPKHRHRTAFSVYFAGEVFTVVVKLPPTQTGFIYDSLQILNKCRSPAQDDFLKEHLMIFTCNQETFMGNGVDPDEACLVNLARHNDDARPHDSPPYRSFDSSYIIQYNEHSRWLAAAPPTDVSFYVRINMFIFNACVKPGPEWYLLHTAPSCRVDTEGNWHRTNLSRFDLGENRRFEITSLGELLAVYVDVRRKAEPGANSTLAELVSEVITSSSRELVQYILGRMYGKQGFACLQKGDRLVGEEDSKKVTYFTGHAIGVIPNGLTQTNLNRYLEQLAMLWPIVTRGNWAISLHLTSEGKWQYDSPMHESEESESNVQMLDAMIAAIQTPKSNNSEQAAELALFFLKAIAGLQETVLCYADAEVSVRDAKENLGKEWPQEALKPSEEHFTDLLKAVAEIVDQVNTALDNFVGDQENGKQLYEATLKHMCHNRKTLAKLLQEANNVAGRIHDLDPKEAMILQALKCCNSDWQSPRNTTSLPEQMQKENEEWEKSGRFDYCSYSANPTKRSKTS